MANLLATHVVGPITCDCWKIAYVTAGTAALLVDDVFVRKVRSGDLIVLRRGAVYSVHPLVPTAATIVYVDSVFMSSNLSWLLRRPENAVVIRALLSDSSPAWVFRPRVEQVNLVGRVFAAIAHPPAEEPRRRQDVNDSLEDLARLFDVLDAVRLLIGRELPEAGTPDPVPAGRGWQAERREVIRATELLHDELARPWTLRRLAASVNVSPSHLSALFRAELGAPPMGYLMELRLQHFSYLLVATGMGIAEAALHSGWRDAGHAARLFRRRFGVTPTAFRIAAVVTEDGLPAIRATSPGL